MPPMRHANPIAAILAFLASATSCAEVPVQKRVDRTHILAAARAVEVLLPHDRRSYLSFRLRAGGIYDRSRPEFVLSLSEGPRTLDEKAGKIEATLIEAIEPIGDQIANYLRENPNASVASSIRAVELERNAYYEEDCPALGDITRQFPAIVATSLSGTDHSRGFYHGMVVQIEGYMYDEFFTFDVEDSNPLFDWALESLSAVKRCEPS